MSIELELSLATNLYGPIGDDIKDRLRRVVSDPSEENWDNAHSIIIVGRGPMVTLWQAVLKVDPGFLTSKQSGKPWPRVPTRETIVEALKFATH